MSKRFQWTCAITLFTAVMLASCSDTPTEQNTPTSSLPNDDVAIRETTLVAAASSSYKQVIPEGGTRNLVGIAGNYSASLLLQYNVNDFPARDTVAVYAARLTLHPDYQFGQQGGAFGFTVYRISQAWNPSTLTADSVGTGFYDPIARGHYSGIASADTAGITVDLDTAMVREWFTTLTSSTNTKYGIILVPDLQSTTVRGFYSFRADSLGYRPTLTVIAGSPTGPQRDTTVYTSGYNSFVATANNVALDPTLLYVQPGIVYRSSLLFDMTVLPRFAIVNIATLTLTKRLETSLSGTPAADPDYAAYLRTGNDSSFALLSGVQAQKSGAIYTFNLRAIVQSWLHTPNYGMVLKAGYGSENTTLDLATFYNQTAADPALRPRLRIVYSVPK